MTIEELIELEREFIDYRNSIGYELEETLKLVCQLVRDKMRREHDSLRQLRA